MSKNTMNILKRVENYLMISLGIVGLILLIYYNYHFSHRELSFEHEIHDDSRVLIIGDLLGLNQVGSLKEINCGVFVPTVLPKNINLTNIISKRIKNQNGVVIPNNFCTTQWESLKFGGIHCESEIETRNLIKLIETQRIKKVVILYNLPSYLNLIDNFLLYLKENKIEFLTIPNEAFSC